MNGRHGWQQMMRLAGIVLAVVWFGGCTGGDSSEPPGGPPHINGTAEFAQQVLQAKGAVLVDFYADWCGPCKKLGPALAELAREHSGELRVVKVNVDRNGGLAQTYGVRGIPHLTLFRDGKPVGTQVGIGSSDTAGIKADLIRWLTAQQVLN